MEKARVELARKKVQDLIKRNKEVLFMTKDGKGRQVMHRTTNSWFASQLHLHHFGIETNTNVKVFVIFKEDTIEVCSEPNCKLFQKQIRHQFN